MPSHLQSDHDTRFDWGPTWASMIAAEVDAVVVVDVLSFTTSVSVAVERGTAVIPYDVRGQAVDTVAAEFGAAIAGRRGTGGPTLSPVSLRDEPTMPPRLVLPSPNGSRIASAVSNSGAAVFAGCLRNAAATAAAVEAFDTVAVVAAGEQWPDGSLRPAVEDAWGAGSILAALEDSGRDLSPEAAGAADAYRLIEGRVPSHLRACASGQELFANGFADDVEVAAEVDTCSTVARLLDRAFVGQVRDSSQQS